MKLFWILAALLATTAVFADEPPTTSPKETPTVDTPNAVPTTVSVSAKGQDVREVLHDLFRQVQRNFVLDLKERVPLYLSLNDVDFEETLAIICQTAGLDYRLQNGIFYLAKAKPRPAPVTTPTTPPATTPSAKPTPPVTAPVARPVPAAPRGRLPETSLNKRVTTRFTKTEFRAIIRDLERQTGLRIEVDSVVPSRFLDAFLIDTSLKYALDQLTQALGLSYTLTDQQSIRIARPNPNRVVALDEDPKP